MSAMSDAVSRGPRAARAKTAHIEAQIKLAEAKAKKAHDQAAAYRRRARGDGLWAKYRKLQADGMDTVADQHRARANQLRIDLAKAKADDAARNAKHVQRTAASTAAEGLTPKPPGQSGRAEPGGQSVATEPAWRADSDEWMVLNPVRAWQRIPSEVVGDPIHPQPKGTPAMTVSGEAVNIEQARSNLDQLKGQVTDLRGSFEGISGSLASGGLNQLAGSLASADDSLDSVLTQITAAEKHLADQEAIAEAAQAAGEMHTDTSFYA